MPVVHLQASHYAPAVVHIRKGAAVRWRWDNPGVLHTVTSRGKQRFKSSGLRKRGTYRVVFRRTGTYRYHCDIHADMHGRIVVSNPNQR